MLEEIKRLLLPEWLTPQDLYEEFHFSVNRQATLRSEGKIPYHKVGSYIRYKRADINSWLDAAKVV